MSRSNLKRTIAVMIAAGAAVSAAHAQSLETLPPNNGSGGVFMNLTPTVPLLLTHFESYFSSTAGGASTLEVWIREGTYVGFDASSAGWTLHETVNATSAGTTALAPINMTNPIILPAGQITAVYIQGVAGQTLRYQGTGTTATTEFSNADLALFSDVARTGSVSFGGTRNSPRVFSGVIHYQYADPTPGACCMPNGSCQSLSVAACVGAGGAFNGAGSDCGSVSCPQPGACCFPNGSCEVRLEASCTGAGGVWSGIGTDCTINPCPQPPTGACCTALGCVILNTFDCTAQGGIYQGDNTVCGTLCDAYHFEVHPNNTKAEANAITLPHGHSIVGRSTAATGTADPASPDYFLVKTQPAALGIYQHKMTLTSSTVGHSSWVRGLSQTAAAAGPWPGPVGTASATENIGQSHQLVGTDRVNMWYGFGKEEQVYYRVSGLASTTGNYFATLQTTPVSPVDIGSFMAGEITITTTGQGHTNDTHIRIYDAQLNPIHGYANDGASTNGGAPANLTTTSFLRREYVAGTYYMAIALTNLATDQGSPCDDNVRTGAMMDFPNVAVDTGTVTATDVSFAIIDGTGTTPIPASRGGRGEIAWFKFTVSGTVETGACCFQNGSCQVLTVAACNGQGGTYQGANTDCATANCPQPGACCLQFAPCTILSAAQCAAQAGVYAGNGVDCQTANCPPPVAILMPIPPFQNTFSSGTTARGMWFVAPADFIIKGLRVPNEGGHPLQNVEVVRLNVEPPVFSAVTNDFVSLARHIGVPSGQIIPVDIPVQAGNIIGILGGCGDTSTGQFSYGNANSFESTILGLPTTIRRLGMQFNMVTNPARDLWQEINAQISRTEVYYTEPGSSCYPNCDGSTTEPILNIDDFTCFINEFALGQTLPPEQQVTSYANCDGSTVAPALNIDDFTCFINEFALGCP